MQRRAVDGGYDSDVDRDEAAALLVEQPQEVREECVCACDRSAGGERVCVCIHTWC